MYILYFYTQHYITTWYIFHVHSTASLIFGYKQMAVSYIMEEVRKQYLCKIFVLNYIKFNLDFHPQA